MNVDIDIGAGVWASDGRRVGSVSGAILSPDRTAMTGVVLREGELFATDLVIPIEWIAEVRDHHVTLAVPSDVVAEQPLLEERAFVPLEPEGVPAPRVWTPPPAVAIASPLNPGWNAPPLIEETWRQAPEGSLVLREGLPVRDAEGETVGRLDELVQDSQNHRVEAIVVKDVPGTAHNKAIPVQWIVRSDEDTGITLAVKAHAVEQLPDYH